MPAGARGRRSLTNRQHLDGGDTRAVTKAVGPAVGVPNGPGSGLGDASEANGAGAPDGGAAAARDCSETPRVTVAGANCLATAASGGAKLDAREVRCARGELGWFALTSGV